MVFLISKKASFCFFSGQLFRNKRYTNHVPETKIVLTLTLFTRDIHCVKSVRIQSFSGPYFPVFRPNMSVSIRIQSKYGKVRTRKTPITNTFHAVVTSNKGFIINASSNPSMRDSHYYKSHTFQYQSTVFSNLLGQIFPVL